MKKNYQKGITAIELMIVVLIFGVLTALAMPQFSNIKERQVLAGGVGEITSALEKAKSKTLASLESSEYGVHFQADKVVIFKGTSYSASASTNESKTILTPASITNVTFGGSSGSSGDVYFDRLSGVPNTTGTITIGTTNYSEVVTIGATGIISQN